MIRHMDLNDVPRAAEIHVFGWRSAYRGIISDDHLFNKMTVPKRMADFKTALADKLMENYVFDDGIIKAVLTIGPCRDEDKPGSFELWGVYVDPFMKKQGIGARMVQFCEEKALERGFGEVCLWVLEENVGARAFYERLGYHADGKDKYLDVFEAAVTRYTKRL